tara:strand:- start:20087 stop:21301 length:1215 start_codon:yes stop_codon:yes gene_type:complete
MASTFKTFTNSDKTSSRSLMHEAIPITGSLISGSYGNKTIITGSAEPHIKTYSHGMFQSVYDYPHLSSSANHLFDITFGFKTGSMSNAGVYTEGNSLVDTQAEKKLNVYNQLSQILVGYDENGNLRKFDRDGNFATANVDHSDKIADVAAICFSRLLVKDEIKKGSFSLTLGVQEELNTAFNVRILITDDGATNNFRSNSPAGEYGFLKAQDGTDGAIDNSVPAADRTVGLIYYQAGIVVLDYTKIFSKKGNPNAPDFTQDKDGILNGSPAGEPAITDSSVYLTQFPSHQTTAARMVDRGTIDQACSALRSRIQSISFNNTTELNSTVYFCRMNHNEFNYSSNPTYLSGSQIRVKEQKSDIPRSYVTTIGLYSADNELLATAKLSEPLRKDPTNELFLRVRLDY